MRLYDAGAMRRMDSEAIAGGVSSLTLMRRAGRHLAEAVLSLGGAHTAAVFCGCGNNGGDGFAAASELFREGWDVRLFLVGDSGRITPDASVMADRFRALGGLTESYSRDAAKAACSASSVLVDALFGFGLHSNLTGDAAEAVSLMNDSEAPVVSADLPSGVEASTGRILGCAVRAAVTVTFTAPKVGHFVLPGGLCTGELRVRDIGVPREIVDTASFAAEAADPSLVCLPRRPRDAHKGNFGRILILGGSVGLTGAPILASEGALRCGAGLVSLGLPESVYPFAAVRCREVMPFPLPKEDGHLSLDALPQILTRLERTDVCLIGPGLGRSESLDTLVCELLLRGTCQFLLDADGINAVSGHRDVLLETACPCVLTPHDGEFSRLGGVFTDGRLAAAHSFAHEYRCILVLKGHRTLTVSPEGAAVVNTTGNPGMAKGGSGDVLGGMIASLMGQGFGSFRAAYSGVFLHGLAGDMAAERYGEYAMTPTDLLSFLPEALRSVTDR